MRAREHRSPRDQHHRQVITRVLLAAFGVAVISCAPNVYKMWDARINTMHASDPLDGVWHTKDDISLLLGGPPASCDTVKTAAARCGFDIAERGLVVRLVLPGSAADRAGLRDGERIMEIDGTVATDSAAAVMILRRKGQNRETVTVTTDTGTYEITPRVPFTEQCYWAITAGSISRAGAYGAWGKQGGSAAGSGVGYSRFYKLTCRFQDGVLVSYASNWQW